MSTLAIVDSLAAAREAAAIADTVTATDNPLLANDRRVPAPVENMDGLVAQADAARLGALALDLAAAVDARLAEAGAAAIYGLEPGHVSLMGVVSRLVASTFHRAAAMARMLDRIEAAQVALLLVDQPRWEPRQPFLPPRFGHPARALGELGFFGARAVSFRAVPAALPATVNETAARGLARRVAVLPVATLLFEALDRARLVPGPRGRVLVGEENEAIREALPWLALRGVRPVRAGKLARADAGARVSFDEPVTVDPRVDDALGATVRDGIARTGAFDAAQGDAIARLLLLHISAGLDHLSRAVGALARRIDGLAATGAEVLLTNGLFGPLGAQAYALCRARGVRIVECEHGVTAGISALTDRKLALAGPPPADRLLVCSARAQRAFAAARRGERPEVVAIGLPDHVRRSLRRPLQRRLARRRLGIGASETVVMHVSTLPCFGNHRPGLAAPSETTTWALERDLIESAYAGLRHRVVYKPYPTQRFPHEPDYADRYRIPVNVVIAGDEDFRYLRAAADVVVTLTPTSTLGWAAGAGAPLVWLDSRAFNPLSDDALRARFKESFLWVDLDAPDWVQALRGLLGRDLADIRADWDAMAAARAALYREVIMGPPGHVGRRAARAVLSLAGAAERDAMAGPARKVAT